MIGVFYKLGEVYFWVGILLNLEIIEITSDVMGGDSTPGGYILEFQCLEVEIDDGIFKIGGI